MCDRRIGFELAQMTEFKSIEVLALAFKDAPPPEVVPDSPEKLLLELPRRNSRRPPASRTDDAAIRHARPRSL